MLHWFSNNKNIIFLQKIMLASIKHKGYIHMCTGSGEMEVIVFSQFEQRHSTVFVS